MRLVEACETKFNKHESFAPRYGWAKKAYDSCSVKHDQFSTDQAIIDLTVELGIGKSMVKSLRHWGVAFRIFTQVKIGNSEHAYPTSIGSTFFHDRLGWDPYCEHIDTLWLLHWWLLAPKSHVPAWWTAFNEFPGLEFTSEELEQWVTDQASSLNKKVSPASIKKDVNLLLRMYSSGQRQRDTYDDQIDSPFRELDLVRPSERDQTQFRFLIGAKAGLAPEIVLFSCIDFLLRARNNDQKTEKTVTISSLSKEAGSPGKVFNLTESALFSLLESCAKNNKNLLDLTEANGVAQLVFKGDPRVIAEEILRNHYSALTGRNCKKIGKAPLVGLDADSPANPPKAGKMAA